jgi:hypothetical protein
MSRDIRLFGLAGLCLLIFGIVLVYISGEVTPDVLNRQPKPTPTRAVTAIVVTQTREPVDHFEGIWLCTQTEPVISIKKNGSFYEIKVGDQTPLVGTPNGAEISVEDGSAVRLNNNYTKLLINNTDGTGITCNRSP